jgi:hypothetical protein
VSVGREAVDRLGTAFLSGDIAAVLAQFAPHDAVLYAGSEVGEVAIGHAALRSLLEELLTRDERYSWRASVVHELVTGSQVHVVAEAELTVHLPDRGGWRPDDRVPYRVSGVLEQAPGTPSDWRWRSCQGSEPVTPTG